MKKYNNQGFSVIEMLISLTILSIVGLSLFGFLAVASKTFRSVNTEVNLQYESQLTINQLKDLMVDSNRGIVYGLQPTVGAFSLVDLETATSEQVLLQTLEAADASNVGTVKRYLLIYNETYLPATDSYQYPVIKVVWDPLTGELRYAEKTFNTIAELEADQYLNSLAASEYGLLSEYASNFSVYMTDSDKKTFTVQLELENAGKKYTTTPSISLRNQVMVSTDLHTVYTPVGVTRPSMVNGVVIKKAGTAISTDSVHIGDVIQYEAEVEVQFGATTGSTAVKWALAGNTTYGSGQITTLSQNGMLEISQYELSPQLTLTATSVTDPTKKAVIVVTVTDSRGEFGYVNSLALGEIIYGSQPAQTTPYGPYAYYGIDYQDSDSYITYVNEDKLLATEKGVTWNITTTAPAGSYVFGNLSAGDTSYGLNAASPVYFGANFLANGSKFTITATTKADNYEGTKISVSKEFIVSGLQEPIVEITPEISLKVASTTMSRNGKLAVTLVANGVYNLGTTIEILPLSGFNTTDETKKIEKITWTKLSENEYKLEADKDLDWNTEFKFKVILHVTGVNNKGTALNKETESEVTIGAVGVTMNLDKTSVQFSESSETIGASITYTNLIFGPGTVESDFAPKITFTNAVYSYYNKGNKTIDLDEKNLTFSGEVLTLNAPLMQAIYKKRHKESYDLTFDTTLSTLKNSITIQNTKITFHN